MGNLAKARRGPSSRVEVLRAAWALPVAEALPPHFLRTRLEKRLAKSPDGAFRHVARMDRSLRKVHLQRLCQWFAAGLFRMEDGRHVRDLLLRFEAAKPRLPVATRDLNRHRSPGDLEAALDEADGIVAADPLGVEALSAEVLSQCAVVASAADWHVIRLDGPVAATHFASGTGWCTRHPATFKGYRRQGPIYVLRHQKRRLQVHAATGQAMDERDRRPEPAAMDAFPEEARQALLSLVCDEALTSPADRGDGWGAATQAASAVTALMGFPRQSGLQGALPYRTAAGQGMLFWSMAEPGSGRRFRYGLLTPGISRRTPDDWIPAPDVIAQALGGRTPPAWFLVDFGPSTPGWGRALADPGTANQAILLAGSPKGPYAHGMAVLDHLATTGTLGTAILADPTRVFERLADPVVRRDWADRVVAALPDPDDPAWAASGREPDGRALIELLCAAWADAPPCRALVAFCLAPAALDAIASASLKSHAHKGLDLVRKILSAGYPGRHRVTAALASHPDYSGILMEAALGKGADLVDAIRDLPDSGSHEREDALDLLGIVGEAFGDAIGRLVGEDDVTLAARACLSMRARILPHGALRDRLVALAHPDFRTAYLGVSGDPSGRLLRRVPGNAADAALLLRLLDLPHTGHLVAALTPSERAAVAETAIARGRAGILAVLPERLAVPETYRRLLPSPEFADALDLAAVSNRHVESAHAAGAGGAYLDRLRAARFANGEGPAWVAEAAAAREASGALPAPYREAGAVARRIAAGADLRGEMAHALSTGSLPATEAYGAVRSALAHAPWLVLGHPELACALGPVAEDILPAHPGLAAYFDPTEVDLSTAVRLASHVPFESLAGIGSRLAGRSGAGPWSAILARLAALPGLGAPDARRILSGLPLDPSYASDRATAARLMARAGTVRPIGPDGRPWGRARTLSCLARAVVASGGKVDRFLPGAAA